MKVWPAADGAGPMIQTLGKRSGDLSSGLPVHSRMAKPIHADNDTLALDSGYASLVPCKIDVTDYDFLAQLKNQLKVES